MRMAVASKGCLRARIKVLGRAAHSSKPELGVNAITQMARLLKEMEIENERLASRKHWLVGSPTLNVGLIEGGTQVNVVRQPARLPLIAGWFLVKTPMRLQRSTTSCWRDSRQPTLS